MGLFRKGKTHIISEFHRTDLVVCSHFREGITLSCSQRNKVIRFCTSALLAIRKFKSHDNYSKALSFAMFGFFTIFKLVFKSINIFSK